MIQKVERALAGDVLTEVALQHTRPYYLVKIEFASGDQFLSTGPATTHSGDAYIEGAITVGSFSWDSDAGQRGSITFLNENNAASALLLNNQIADVPVTIFKVYTKVGGGNTTPVAIIKGTLDDSALSPRDVSMTVVTSGAGTELVPNQFHNQDNGFNHLVRAGTVLVWGGEKFILNQDR